MHDYSTCVRRACITVASIPTLLSAPVAWGQESASDLEEITVTAQKRVERLLDVPLSVSVISAETFLDRNQSKLQDYFASVPGLNVNAQGNGQINVAIRGVTTGQTTNPAVGIVIDDVPFGSSSVLAYASRILPDIDPAALSQIEVLRGPQGTLYGAASIGGLMKFVTAEPSIDRLSGHVELGVNGVRHGETGFSGRASWNMPITDTFAIRGSGFYRRDAGYVDNILTGEKDVNRIDSYGGQLAARWTPTEGLAVKLAMLLQSIDGKGSSEVDTDYRLIPSFGPLAQARVPGADFYNIDARLYYGTINYDFGSFALTSITAYGTSSYEASVEASYVYGELADATFGVSGAALTNDFFTRKFSQEVRLASDGKGAFDWLIGGFYTRERTAAEQNFLALDLDGNNEGVLIRSIFPTRFREIAAFGSVTVKVGERFDIQAGGRYGGNRQKYSEIGSGPLLGDYAITQSSRDSKFTYHVTSRFRFNRDLMIYGRVATGYRVGGANPLSTAAAVAAGVPSEYGPDTTTNYEIGLKGSALNRTLTFDLSLYHISWKDIQLALINPDNGYFYFVNGPSAKSEGAEATISITPNDLLRISLSGAYNNARLTENLPANGGYGFDGDRLPFSARYTVSLSVDQDIPLSGDVKAFVGGTLSFVGDRLGEFGSDASNPRVIYPDYAQIDLRAGAEFHDWTVSIFATNLTDKRGVVGVASNALSPSTTSFYGANYIRPRSIGATVAKAF